MSDIFKPGQMVFIHDGDVRAMLVDDNKVKHFVDVVDGTPGVVQGVVGGGLYVVRTRGQSAPEKVIIGSGLFAEPTLDLE